MEDLHELRHSLKNKISTIFGCSELLEFDLPSEDVKNYIKIIKETCEELIVEIDSSLSDIHVLTKQ